MKSTCSIVNGNIHTYKLTTFLWWRDATPTIKKGISHQQQSKGPFGESPSGGLFRGGSLNKNPFVGPPFNPSDGAYGWPSFGPNMWVPIGCNKT